MLQAHGKFYLNICMEIVRNVFEMNLPLEGFDPSQDSRYNQIPLQHC